MNTDHLPALASAALASMPTDAGQSRTFTQSSLPRNPRPTDRVRVSWRLAPGTASLITATADWLTLLGRRTTVFSSALYYGLVNVAVGAALEQHREEGAA